MIVGVIVDEKTGNKTFNLVCEKSGRQFMRIARKENAETEPMLSNTESAFSDEVILSFKEWMRDEGYLKTDCWCGHIKEFVNANI